MGRPSLPEEFKTEPISLRLQTRIKVIAQEKANQLGMKLPAYISQLIVKDNEGG